MAHYNISLDVVIDFIKSGTPASYATIAFALTVLYMLLGKRRPKNAPPTARIGAPLVGNYIEFAKNPVIFIEECRKKFGSIYTVPMLHKNLTFLLGPEVSAPFFSLDDKFMSQPEVYRFMTPVFGKGVVYDAEPEKRYNFPHTFPFTLLFLLKAFIHPSTYPFI